MQVCVVCERPEIYIKYGSDKSLDVIRRENVLLCRSQPGSLLGLHIQVILEPTWLCSQHLYCICALGCIYSTLGLSPLLPGPWREPPAWLPTWPTPDHFPHLNLKISPWLILPWNLTCGSWNKCQTFPPYMHATMVPGLSGPPLQPVSTHCPVSPSCKNLEPLSCLLLLHQKVLILSQSL